MNKKILSWLESLMEEEALGLAPNPYQEAMKKNMANQATAQAVQKATQPTAPVDLGSQQMNSVPSIADLVITNNPNITASKALEIGGIDTLRHPDKNGMHFGNPFSPLQHSYASVKVNSIKDSVDAFRAWLQGDSRYANVEPQRRQWIVNQINNGSLKGKPLVYYTNKIPDNSYGTNMYNSKTAPNHAHVLLDMINNGIPAIQNTVDKGSQQMANTAQQFYEVSSAGDKRFSALYATFKPGTNIFGQDVSNRTIESVYQHGVKQGDWITNNNYKTGKPMSKAIITGNTEDDSYTQGYLPLWQEWAKQNPDLIEDLRTKSKGMKLSDKFARTRVSQARALTDILNTVPSNEQLLSNLANSTELPLPKGKVISASYRTDIPAFYSSKLAEAIKKGSITIPTKFGMSNKTISLRPEDVQVMELWTKNPKPMLNNGSLQTLKDYYGDKFYFQYSLNNYDKLLESNIPDDAIDTFKALSNELGKDRVIWRYDPIIMSEGNGPYTVQSHLDNYKNLAQILAPYTNHNVISFVDNYGKLKSTFAKLGLREPTIEEQKDLAKGISEINKQYGLDISTCAEGLDLDEFGIRHGACTDPVIIEKLSGEKALLKELANRSNCGCAANTDIGAYNTCHNGCTYCYATNPSIPNIEHTATGFRDLQKYLNSKDLGEAQFKVISGGQTGIDILGVQLAKEYGLPTGGTIGMYPNGKYVIEADDAIDRSQFGFTTTDNTYYPYRTSQNVQNSDGTIYFKTDDDSRGYQATRREAMKYGKPFLENPASVDDAYKFITDNNIKTLNIAGNRGSKLPSELRLSTEELLRALFNKFKK